MPDYREKCRIQGVSLIPAEETQERMISVMGKLDASLEGVKVRLDEHGAEVNALKLSQADLHATRRHTAWLAVLLVPAILAGVISAIQGHERLTTVERDYTNDRARVDRVQQAAAELATEVRVLSVESERQRDATERLLNALDRLEVRDRKR